MGKLLKRDFRPERYEQVLDAMSRVGVVKVPKKKLYFLRENVPFRMYLAFEEIHEYNSEDVAEGEITVELEGKLVDTRKDSKDEVKVWQGTGTNNEEKGDRLSVEDVDYSDNEIDIDVEEEEGGKVIVHYFGQKGAVRLVAEAPRGLAGAEAQEVYGNDFNILHALDQTTRASGVLIGDQFYLPEDFRISLYVDCPEQVVVGSPLSELMIPFEETSMSSFRAELKGMYPELGDRPLDQVVVAAWREQS